MLNHTVVKLTDHLTAGFLKQKWEDGMQHANNTRIQQSQAEAHGMFEVLEVTLPHGIEMANQKVADLTKKGYNAKSNLDLSDFVSKMAKK